MARKKSQVEKFREAAREAEADQSEDAFNATLKTLAKAPRKGGQQGSPSSAEEAEADASPHPKSKDS
jgi:hypothetical protein